MFPRASFFAVFDIVIVPLIRRSLILRRTSLRYLFYLQAPAGTSSTRRKFSLIFDSVPSSCASLIQMLRNLFGERNGRAKENLSLLVTRVSIDITFAETRWSLSGTTLRNGLRALRLLQRRSTIVVRYIVSYYAPYHKSSQFWGKRKSDAERRLSADNRRYRGCGCNRDGHRATDGRQSCPDGDWIVKRKAWWVNPTGRTAPLRRR